MSRKADGRNAGIELHKQIRQSEKAMDVWLAKHEEANPSDRLRRGRSNRNNSRKP